VIVTTLEKMSRRVEFQVQQQTKVINANANRKQFQPHTRNKDSKSTPRAQPPDVCRMAPKMYWIYLLSAGDTVTAWKHNGERNETGYKLTTSRESPVAYHVWSTSVAAIVSYPAHRTTDRLTERPITLLRHPCRSKNIDVVF